MHFGSQACSCNWHSSAGCCPDLQGIDARTRYRTEHLEAGVPAAQVCSHLVLEPLLPCALLSTGDGEREPLPGLCTPFAVRPSQRHLHRWLCACVLHQLPGQTPSSSGPQGLGVGPRPLCGSCCVNPRCQPVPSPGASGFTPLAAPVCPSVAVSVWGTRSGSWTSRFLVSVTLCHPPGEEALGFLKELGIKLNPAQIPSSAILIGWGILDERLHLSQP